MAVEGNGKAVETVNAGMNGHSVSPRIRRKKPMKSFFRSIVSTSVWLLTWYSIISVIFRCPQVGEVTDSSPKICKPYFTIRSAILPHTQPYYHTYAASYVDAAKPYYDTLDRSVITPLGAYGKKYGAPRVAQAQAFGQAQWERSIQPQVSKLNSMVQTQYADNLGPHVNKAVEAISPYCEIIKNNALQTYYASILPTYNAVQPYVRYAYSVGEDFTIQTGIPHAKWAWRTGMVFLDRTVWPKVRILYGESVEPQLVRIGERLGRYRDGKKLQAAVDDIDRSSAAVSATSTASPESTALFSAQATETNQTAQFMASSSIGKSEEAPIQTPLSEAETAAKAQTIVQADLKNLQEKFAKAADEGSDELEIRITEITDRFVKNQAGGVGSALLIQLEETIKSELKSLKNSIQSIVKKSAGADDENAEKALSTAIRKAGVTIKNKAQAIRTWKQNYDHETNFLVGQAAQDTFNIIDHIRDLGLQEIGMRWAWLDGVTHKDWTKYHAMKTKFDDWRKDVEDVATAHPGLKRARAASEDVESHAMGIATDAAEELAHLKEAGKLKIMARDSSDDFSITTLQAAAAVAEQKMKEKISQASQAVLGTSQGSIESLGSTASFSVVDAVSSISFVAESISSSILGIPQESLQSVISVAKSGVKGAVDRASVSVIGTSQGAIESVESVLSSSAHSIVSDVSSSTMSVATGVLSSVISIPSAAAEALPVKKGSSSVSSASSKASKNASSASELLSSVASSASKVAASSASSLSSEAISSASSLSTAISSNVWGGADAQVVEARQIVFEDVIEDDETYSEKIQSMASEAGERFSDITNAVIEAISKPTSTQGGFESITSLASDQWASAYKAASVAMYGTEQGTRESITSAASSKYSDAVKAASVAIYGTSTPAIQVFAAQASASYREAISRASDHYSQAMSVVSVQVSGTPQPVHEQMYSSVQSAYSDSINAASLRLQVAMSAVATAVYGPPQGAFDSISSLAASRLSEGINLASEQYESAKTFVGATPTPFLQKHLDQAQIQYYAQVGLAHARYTEFISAASSVIMPTQTPFHESLYNRASTNILGTSTGTLEIISSALSESLDVAASQVSTAIYGSETPWSESVASAASQNWESLVTKASMQIYGQPTPFHASVYSQAGEYAAQATDGAVAQYAAIQAVFSELVSGKEPEFTESVYSRLSSAYYTGAGAVVSSASSMASEVYASASSVINSVFTPPPELESILDSASSQVNAAVNAASIQFYGSSTGYYEAATSSAAAAYSSASSAASVKVYGTPVGYVEAAQNSIADAASSAQKAISDAIYGTSTPAIESATSYVADTYASASSVVAENIVSVTSVANENYAAASAKISSMVYGPEQGAVESAHARLSAVVESARAKLAGFAGGASEEASEAIKKASEGLEEFASSFSSVVESATSYVKDEL